MLSGPGIETALEVCEELPVDPLLLLLELSILLALPQVVHAPLSLLLRLLLPQPVPILPEPVQLLVPLLLLLHSPLLVLLVRLLEQLKPLPVLHEVLELVLPGLGVGLVEHLLVGGGYVGLELVVLLALEGVELLQDALPLLVLLELNHLHCPILLVPVVVG